MTHPALLDDESLLAACDFARSRASGPGGQHRNKVETHVTLTHRDSGISGQAGERRSQADNKKVALFRLRLNLALAIRGGGGPPSALWRSRCKGGRVTCSTSHRDFPAILCEALDAIVAAGDDPKPAAEHLGCSASQLIKLIKQHPPAFQAWNARRQAAGQHPLR